MYFPRDFETKNDIFDKIEKTLDPNRDINRQRRAQSAKESVPKGRRGRMAGGKILREILGGLQRSRAIFALCSGRTGSFSLS